MHSIHYMSDITSYYVGLDARCKICKSAHQRTNIFYTASLDEPTLTSCTSYKTEISHRNHFLHKNEREQEFHSPARTGNTAASSESTPGKDRTSVRLPSYGSDTTRLTFPLLLLGIDASEHKQDSVEHEDLCLPRCNFLPHRNVPSHKACTKCQKTLLFLYKLHIPCVYPCGPPP